MDGNVHVSENRSSEYNDQPHVQSSNIIVSLTSLTILSSKDETNDFKRKRAKLFRDERQSPDRVRGEDILLTNEGKTFFSGKVKIKEHFRSYELITDARVIIFLFASLFVSK